MNKVLIDTGPGGAVPYLPLDQLLKQQKPPSQSAPPGAEAPAGGPTATTNATTGAN
jgi:hypothetical protein